MTNTFNISKIKKQSEEIEVPVHYVDGDETELTTLKTPKTKDVINIRRKLADYIKKEKGDDNDVDILSMGTLEYLGALCLEACIKAYQGDNASLKDLTEEDYMAFVYDTGGAFSDMTLAAAKLCGFHDIAKAGKEVQGQLDKLTPEFNPEADNPPV